MSAARPLDIFIIAGEVSGDHLGGALMACLRELQGGAVQFRGVGGARMTEQGLSSLFPMQDIAVMGFLPVLARLPQLIARINRTASAVIENPPDILIIIDSPDFTHRVAKKVRKRLPELKVINYVSPTVWAWRPGRARKMTRYVDHVLALLPFEPQAHRQLGGPACTYVGHSLIGQMHEFDPRAEDIARRAAQPPLLAVLPGSRRSEIARLLDVFGQTLDTLASQGIAFEAVLPAVTHLEADIKAGIANWRTPVRLVQGESEKHLAFRQARAALAASGTVTLELGLAQTPAVVAYKVSAIEKMILSALVKTRWASLTNIILEREVYPEFLQEAATPQALAASLRKLLEDTPQRAEQMAALGELRARMLLPDGETPAHRAAQAVLDIWQGKEPK